MIQGKSHNETEMKEDKTVTENMVEVKHLTKVFGKQKVLDDVNICIPKQCVYGLLGPNGA